MWIAFLIVVIILAIVYIFRGAIGIYDASELSITEFLFNSKSGIVALVFAVLSILYFFFSAQTYVAVRQLDKFFKTFKKPFKIMDNYFKNLNKKEDDKVSVIDLSPDEIVNLPKYQAFLRLGTEVTLIETYPPKLTEVKSINIPKKNQNPLLTKVPEKEYNFLRDKWINL